VILLEKSGVIAQLPGLHSFEEHCVLTIAICNAFEAHYWGILAYAMARSF
jgi:hypothetical protein